MYDVYSKFDIEKHKSTFTNYLEVIILENGNIEYAVPSHQEYLIQLGCTQTNLTRVEFCDRCPPEYYFDFISWLCKETQCVSVWNDFIIGCPNDLQMNSLVKLRNENLYKGEI